LCKFDIAIRTVHIVLLLTLRSTKDEITEGASNSTQDNTFFIYLFFIILADERTWPGFAFRYGANGGGRWIVFMVRVGWLLYGELRSSCLPSFPVSGFLHFPSALFGSDDGDKLIRIHENFNQPG
jgi:hypothetical protein